MKFGLDHIIFAFDGNSPAIVDSLRRLVTRAEALGFDSFWVMDHFHQAAGQPQDPILEGWITPAVLAGFTSRIKLGTLVTGNAYRHPSVLAKMGATLDVLSKGRLFMGIGAAWNREEAEAYGISFPPSMERLQRLDEAVQIIRKMWTEEQTTFDGKFYQIRQAYCNPKPIQKPHPPIMIGGGGEKETLKIVAKYADACNLFGSPDVIRRKLTVLREHCKAVGREYDSILKTKMTGMMIDEDKEAVEKRFAGLFKHLGWRARRISAIHGTPDEVRRQVEAFREVGIEYLIVNWSFEPQKELEGLDLFAHEIVRNF